MQTNLEAEYRKAIADTIEALERWAVEAQQHGSTQHVKPMRENAHKLRCLLSGADVDAAVEWKRAV